MEKRLIGSLEISIVGIGCNNFGGRIDQAKSTEVVNAALEAGINFFDTADSSGEQMSEEFLGRALKSRRDEAVIATKFGTMLDDDHFGAKPAYVRSAAEDSLRRLGVDHIDLLQLHRPDPSTPIADTLGALGELVEEGKVLEIGCSNFSIEQLREAATAITPGDRGFASLQNEYSLLNRDAESNVLPECEAREIGFLPFRPLANGLLTGKYRRDAELPEGGRITNFPVDRQASILTRRNLDMAEALAAFAENHGRSILQVSFAWLFARPAIRSVIAGATSAQQVRANAATTSWELTPDEVAEIDKLARVNDSS